MFYRRGIPILLLSLLSSPPSALADWSAAAEKDYRALEKRMSVRTNGQLAGIWGAAAVTFGKILRTPRFKRTTYRNDYDYERGGGALEYVVTRTAREVSPLVVYFPGVFGDAVDSGALMAARQFRRGRNHAIALPNPWGPNFQGALPKFMPGDFDREARAMVDLIEDGIRFIGRRRISEIHFFGESYGGFLAPATAHYMNAQGVFHVKSVTSVSAPFSIGNAIESADRMADENESIYFDGGCQSNFRSLFRRLGFAFELITHPSRAEIYGKNGVACSDGIFAYQAFQQPLFHLAQALNVRSPSPKWEAREKSYWFRKLRFRDLPELFFGVGIDSLLRRDAANLATWVELIRAEGTEPLALFARNDPLNPPVGRGSYAQVKAYAPGETLVLSEGGHLGFRGNRDYRKLLRHQFNISAAGDASAPDDAFDDAARAADDEYALDEDSEFSLDES